MTITRRTVPRGGRWEDSARTIADAAGRGEVRFRSPRPGGPLGVHRVSVRAEGATIPQARLYHDRESAETFIAGTIAGNLDTAVFPPGHLELQPGRSVLVVWSGADPGQELTATIEGEWS